MGRLDANNPAHPQSSDQTPFQPPPQGYPNHHDNPLSPQPELQSEDLYTAENDQNMNAMPQTATRSFIPQSSPESMPPPEAYPPQKPAMYPPQQTPTTYPPQQEPVQFPPQPQPVQFPPQQTNYTPQNYNYASPQPQGVNYVNSGGAGYQPSPMKMGPPEGIAIGSQYLAPTQGWTNNNGLFDCAEDPENAIITACFPCITFGQIAEIVDNGQTSCATSGLIYGVIAALIGIPCIMSCSYRTKIRSRYGLMETPAPDWVTHCFCEWCALCQEYRELKARGLDPAIGWQGNMARNQQMQQYPTMTPPMNQTMM
uniref:protein PLANT CADMIUM RESISTANCE 6-like n=1 Tax=Erigeron canadensis TaxID=72917 RepID=UPI001CB99BAA|nr:protein PLANT CADMIUM RESISTANCE 6-like [Erigeron canadensis]